MDGLSGAASIVAVVSLAIQLGDSIYKFSRFLKSIQDAPRELQLLISDLDRLRQILAEVAQVAELQKELESAPAPSLALYAAIQECQLRFQSLEAYASKITSRIEEKGIRKAWTPLKIPIQKDALQKLQGEMRQSIDHLGTLLVLNSTKIQLAHLGQAQRFSTPVPSPEISTISLHESRILPTKAVIGPLLSKQQTSAASLYAWHRSSRAVSYGTFLYLLGYCITSSEFHFSRAGLGPRQNDTMKRHDWSIVIFFWFINRYLEFQSRVYCGQPERRWRICPVDPQRQSPAWELCREGDTQGILKLFSQGLSPYLKDGQGRSLLNAASIGCHVELCRVLQQQDVSLCAYEKESYDFAGDVVVRRNRMPFYDLHWSDAGQQLFWDTLQMLLDHKGESEEPSLANSHGSILYFGDQGFINWRDCSTSYYRIREPHTLVSEISSSLEILSDEFLDTDELGALKDTLRFCLTCLGQVTFSIMCEEDLSLLEALFSLDWQHNIGDLGEVSEELGREWCVILDKCAIDAQNFIDRMLDLNGGNDVYLEPIDYGTRGIGRRRLMRGRYSLRSIRWEWDPPPEENPYEVLEAFEYLANERLRNSLSVIWYLDWPFNYNVKDSDQQYMRKEQRKAKKNQRKDKANRRLRKVPGTFPD